MANTETWVFGDETGKVVEKEVNPDDYVDDGVNMFFDTRHISETNYMTSVVLYSQILGQEIKPGEIVTEPQKVILSNKDVALLVLDFYRLVEMAGFQNLYDAYTAGQLPQELETILNYKLGMNQIILNEILDRGGFREIVLNAVNAGKIDFKPFNTTGDKNPEWFLKYSFSPVPIPGYIGTVKNMGKLTPTIKAETVLEQHKRAIKQEIKEHTANALREKTPESLLLLAEEIKKSYQTLKRKGKKGKAVLNIKPRTPDFVVDVTAGKIFDLREYSEILRESMEPGIEALKEFYQLLKQEIRLYKNKIASPAKIYGSFTDLTTEIPLVPIKTTPETMKIYNLTGKIEELYEQQELPGVTESGESLYRYEKELTTRKGSVVINISGAKKGELLDPGIQKIMILNNWLLNKSGNRNFAFSTEEYMIKCEKDPNKASVKRDFKKALEERLEFLRTKYSFTVKSANGGFQKHSVVSGWGKDKGGRHFSVSLSPEYCAYIQNNTDASYSWVVDYIFRSDERNPHIIPFLMTLTKNRQIKNNIKTGRANTISLRALVENDEDLLYKLKKRGINGNYNRYVIAPTFNTLFKLISDNVIEAEFVDKNGNKHTNDEIKFVTIGDFLDSDKWRINYEFVAIKQNPAIKELFKRKNQTEELPQGQE